MLPLVPKVLYFAQLVDVPSVSSEALRLDVELISVAELSAKLAQRGGAWERVFRAPRGLRIAVNKSFTELDTLVRRTDKIGFVPSGQLA